MINALIINEKDNVCVAIEKIKKGTEVSYIDFYKKYRAFTARNDINIYHKIAIKEIKKGEYAIKYGEHIGIALKDISVGEHVHVQTIEGRRENLENLS